MEIFNTHGYSPGQEVLVDAEFLIGVLSFCQRVIDSQPNVLVPMVVPADVREITDKDTKEVLRYDIDYKEFPNVTSFLTTAFSNSGGIPAMTELSLMAFQMQQALLNYHQKNIDNGIAKPVPQTQNKA